MVHAQTQDWFILNISEQQNQFGIDVATNIMNELKSLISLFFYLYFKRKFKKEKGIYILPDLPKISF